MDGAILRSQVENGHAKGTGRISLRVGEAAELGDRSVDKDVAAPSAIQAVGTSDNLSFVLKEPKRELEGVVRARPSPDVVVAGQRAGRKLGIQPSRPVRNGILTIYRPATTSGRKRADGVTIGAARGKMLTILEAESLHAAEASDGQGAVTRIAQR